MHRRTLLSGAIAGIALGLSGCANPLELVASGSTPDLSAPAERPSVDDDVVHTLAAGNATFGFELLHTITSDDPDQNLMLSPVSLGTAIGMAYAGAAGQAAEEMRETLSYPDEHVHEAIGRLLYDLGETEADSGTLELAVANALWRNQAYDFHAEYVAVLEDQYGSSDRELDFGASDDARETINEWCADRTNDRIDELIPPGVLTPTTPAVLTNAVYLLADWAEEFDPDRTGDAAFQNRDGSTSTVQMMHQESQFGTTRADIEFLDDGQCRLVELPYVAEEIRMVLMLPPADSFDAFEAGVTGDWLIDQTEDLASQQMELALPQFEFQNEFGLSDHLTDMGMEAPFQDEADFSEMAPAGDGFYIAEIFHDTFVSVDEAGTEAAAATGVAMDDSAPPMINFDRPFLFAITHHPTRSVLFLGRVVEGEELA